MKNTSNILIAVVILVIGGVGAYALLNSDAPMTNSDKMDKTDGMVQENTAAMAPAEDAGMFDDTKKMESSDEIMMKTGGTYVPFTPEALAAATDSRRVLFFYASWCPTCKPADVSFTENVTQIPDDVTVIRVNYNDTETDKAEKELAAKYGVTYQHTFVQIDAAGEEVTKWNGGKIEELLSNIQ